MNEAMEEIGKLSLLQQGQSAAHACAIEALIMVIGSIHSAALEPMEEILLGLAKQQLETMEDESKAGFHAVLSRYLDQIDALKQR